MFPLIVECIREKERILRKEERKMRFRKKDGEHIVNGKIISIYNYDTLLLFYKKELYFVLSLNK